MAHRSAMGLQSNEDWVEGIWNTKNEAYTKTAEEVLWHLIGEEWISQEAWHKIEENEEIEIESSEDLSESVFWSQVRKENF